MQCLLNMNKSLNLENNYTLDIFTAKKCICQPFLGPFTDQNDRDFPTLLYTSMSEILTLLYSCGLKKGTPLGWSLPIQAIMGSTFPQGQHTGYLREHLLLVFLQPHFVLGVTIGRFYYCNCQVLQQATWILQQHCNRGGTIAIVVPQFSRISVFT